MVAFRALFWFCVVCTLMPYKSVDLTKGDLDIDRTALVAQITNLPNYCKDHGAVCTSARDLLTQAAKTGGALANQLAVVLQDHLRTS